MLTKRRLGESWGFILLICWFILLIDHTNYIFDCVSCSMVFCIGNISRVDVHVFQSVVMNQIINFLLSDSVTDNWVLLVVLKIIWILSKNINPLGTIFINNYHTTICWKFLVVILRPWSWSILDSCKEKGWWWLYSVCYCPSSWRP